MSLIYTRNKNTDRPWHKDMTLYKHQIIVGIACEVCGEIFYFDRMMNTTKCPDCQYKHRRTLQKESERKKRGNDNIPSETPKYCVDCGKLMKKSKWKPKNATKCDVCQYGYVKEFKPSPPRTDRDVTVGVTCVKCGKFTPAKNYSKKYCEECVRRNLRYRWENEILSQEEKNKIAKEYIKKTKKPTKKERLGTFDTSSKYGKVEHKKDTFEKELIAVKELKKRTFKKKQRDYSPGAGDYIRGIANNYEE